MATKNVSENSASDLQICIDPRSYTSFRGTAAQLIAEGLIPSGFQWPAGAEHVTVEVGVFTHRIGRKRPDGHKGLKSSWTSGDFWYVHRELTNQPKDGHRAADIYTKQNELAEAIYRASPEYAHIENASRAAWFDDKYQAFRSLVIPE